VRACDTRVIRLGPLSSSNDPARSQPAPSYGFRAIGFHGFGKQRHGRRVDRSVARLALGGARAVWSTRLRQDASRSPLAGAGIGPHYVRRNIDRSDVAASFRQGSTAGRDRRCGSSAGARPASPLQFLHRARRQPADHRLPAAGILANSARRSTFALACGPHRRDWRPRRRAPGSCSHQTVCRSSAPRRAGCDRLFAQAHRPILRGR